MNGSSLAAAEALLRQRKVSAAFAQFAQAQQFGEDPDRCAAGLWMAHMLHGDYELAWQQSDAIRRRGAPDAHRFWHGEPIDGKRLMLRSLHGFGDAVQYLRFAPALRARVAELTLEVAPHLVELARCLPGPDRVICWDEPAPPAYDVQAEVTELPYLLRTTLDTLPPPMRIAVSPALLHQARAAIGTHRPALGLVWSSGVWNTQRSVSWELLDAATKNLGYARWNLQGGPQRECAADQLHDAPELCDGGLLPMAAMLQSLDLLLTTDTLAAHLAASLGTPTWLLLQQEADWRWMAAGDSSPWYPGMRLFRNRVQDGWEQTLADVRRALEAQHPAATRGAA